MKKILLILLFPLMHSCSYTVYYRIGEPYNEFTSKNPHAPLQVQEQSQDRTVLKACNQYNYDCLFFYFNSQGFLYQVDRGDYVPDFIIQTNH